MKHLRLHLCSLLASFVLTTAVSAVAQQPDPGLVSLLTSKLHVTPEQATGGAGAIFSLAKGQLSAADFGKISSVVPGMGGFLNAAPKTESSTGSSGSSAGPASSASSAMDAVSGAAGAAGSGAAGAAGSAAPAAAGGAGGLLSLGSAFKSLGMSPQMATQFAPVMQQYLSQKGGSTVASLFATGTGIH